MPRALHGAFIIAMNAVPLIGVLFFDWSIGTTLALFWAETLVLGTANVIRIVAHRRATRTRGHERTWQTGSARTLDGPTTEPGSFLLSYGIVLYPFSIAHGVFLFVVLAMLSHHRPEAASNWSVDFETLGAALAVTTAIGLGELGLDLMAISEKPFSWLEKRVQRSLAQIVIFHLGLLGGAVLLSQFETPLSFLPLIVLLKTLFDLGSELPKRPLPAAPPRWFRYLAQKLKKNADVEWAEVLALERRQEEQDEERVR